MAVANEAPAAGKECGRRVKEINISVPPLRELLPELSQLRPLLWQSLIEPSGHWLLLSPLHCFGQLRIAAGTPSPPMKQAAVAAYKSTKHTSISYLINYRSHQLAHLLCVSLLLQVQLLCTDLQNNCVQLQISLSQPCTHLMGCLTLLMLGIQLRRFVFCSPQLVFELDQISLEQLNLLL